MAPSRYLSKLLKNQGRTVCVQANFAGYVCTISEGRAIFKRSNIEQPAILLRVKRLLFRFYT